jgi:hypothetical protein
MTGQQIFASDFSSAEGWEICESSTESVISGGRAEARASWQVFSPVEVIAGGANGLKIGFDITWSAMTSNVAIGLEGAAVPLCEQNEGPSSTGTWLEFDTRRHEGASGEPWVGTEGASEIETRGWAIPPPGTHRVEAEVWPTCEIGDIEYRKCERADPFARSAIVATTTVMAPSTRSFAVAIPNER